MNKAALSAILYMGQKIPVTNNKKDHNEQL
jgi:hypothetical protein